MILTIGGLDSGGAAGLHADLQTARDHGFFVVSILTTITAQNPDRILKAMVLPKKIVLSQWEAIAKFPIKAIKISLFGGVKNAKAIYRILKDYKNQHRLPIVLDPVIAASSGYRFVDDAQIEHLIRLSSLATVITPNREEFLKLYTVLFPQAAIENSRSLSAWIPMIKAFGNKLGCAVVLTGWEKDATTLTDIALIDQLPTYFDKKKRLFSLHGSGCIFSTALACALAHSKDPRKAVEDAELYMEKIFDRYEKEPNPAVIRKT